MLSLCFGFAQVAGRGAWVTLNTVCNEFSQEIPLTKGKTMWVLLGSCGKGALVCKYGHIETEAQSDRPDTSHFLHSVGDCYFLKD